MTDAKLPGLEERFAEIKGVRMRYFLGGQGPPLILVHGLGGAAANWTELVPLLIKRHRLLVIEDACQAVGVTYKGRRVGTIGEVGAFSFNQYKNLNSGEGGAVLTNDDRIFTRARMYHDVGSHARIRVRRQ